MDDLNDTIAETSGIPAAPSNEEGNGSLSADAPSGPVHLVLLLHGLYGSPDNLWCLEAEMADAHKAHREAATAASSDEAALDVVVLNAASYKGPRTWDGIDVNAQRVSDELDAEIERLEAAGRSVNVVSITGYSLGGLIARALVGQLHAREPSFFHKHKPGAFATIATPHLGVIKYPSWQSQWVHALGQHLFSRTGQQLYCLDTNAGAPLLATMAHPDRIYLRALSLFRSITIFANGVNDLTVPYCTAAICAHDPFIEHDQPTGPHVHIELDGHIVCSWHCQDDGDEVEAIVAPDVSSSEATPVPVPQSKEAQDVKKEVKDVAKQATAAAAVAVAAAAAATASKARRSPKPTPATSTGLHGQRPWLPPVFYLNKPGVMRYALFPLIPFLIPLVLSFVAITFAYHSFQSSQRLQVLQANSERRPLLLGVDTKSYGAAGPRSSGNEEDDNDTPLPTGANTPQLVPAASASAYSQPLLTPLQKSMITHLDALPLERVVAWFPAAFNAHAVIIARNARNPRFEWQGAGKQVVRDWAGRMLVAGAE